MQQLKWKQFIVVVAALALIAGAYTAWSYCHRPLFCNRFGFHPDRGCLPQWWPYPDPQRDAAGNLMQFDFPLNIIVLVRWNEPLRFSPSWLHTQGRDLPIDRPGGNGVIHVKLEKDHLYFIDPASGTVKGAIIPPGCSRKVYDQLEQLPQTQEIPSLGQFLKTQLTLPFDPSTGG